MIQTVLFGEGTLSAWEKSAILTLCHKQMGTTGEREGDGRVAP